MLGLRFGLLTAVSRDLERPGYFVCDCVCGTAKSVRQDHLRSGKTISCGCEHKRRASARASNMHKANTKHGMANTRTHSIWMGMLSRCRNPNSQFYSHYGERGIDVCDRWLEFANFLSDMGTAPPGMEIDRIDNDAGYSPQNCRWASRRDQQNNRRNNRLLTHAGKTMTLTQWARHVDLNPSTVSARFHRGEAIEAILRPASPGEDLRAAARQKAVQARRALARCKHGHEFSAENTSFDTKGGRICKECRRRREAERRRRMA